MLSQATERLDYQNSDFEFIQQVMSEHAGIDLHDGKKELVYSRLAKRVRSLGLNSFRDYCSILGSDQLEISHCINFMTTNVTSFFRERHHFDFLEREVLSANTSGRLRIWSAGCSTGEEPYSIAFTCAAFPKIGTRIIATDLDSEVIRKATEGVYDAREVTELRRTQLKNWFLRGKGAMQGKVKVIKDFRNMVAFSQLNLKEDWRHSERFDVIFCRNVMIYFDNELRARLLDKFHNHLNPGGYLMLGHSESLFGLSDKYEVVGRTIHRKKGVDK